MGIWLAECHEVWRSSSTNCELRALILLQTWDFALIIFFFFFKLTIGEKIRGYLHWDWSIFWREDGAH